MLTLSGMGGPALPILEWVNGRMGVLSSPCLLIQATVETINEWLPLLRTAVLPALDRKVILGAPTTSMDTDQEGVCCMCVL